MRPNLLPLLAALPLLAFAAPAFADDVDGLDCGRIVIDYGDAPEDGAPFLTPYGPRIGRYPTCLSPSAAGTQEIQCGSPQSTAPGLTGYMRNYNTFPSHYWLGCYDLPTIGLTGIDDDPDGKVGPPGGPSNCSGGPTDGNLVGALTTYAQDESYADGDAGLNPNQVLVACFPQTLTYQTANCGNETLAYLNVLVDVNFDGDWNDNLHCTAGCISEWAVKNVRVPIGTGCQTYNTPPIYGGPALGECWVRITLTDDPVDDDFPWAGSANRLDGQYAGGETEDHLVEITAPDPVRQATWGKVKTLYR